MVIEDEFFLQVREQLRYWAYTIHQIDETLDSSLIEGRGRQLLFQAINARNLTAFVGSGISAAYGRLTWRDWRDEQLRVVERNMEAFLNLTEASLELIECYSELVRPDPISDKKAKRIVETMATPLKRPIAEGRFEEIRGWVFGKDAAGKENMAQDLRHNTWRWLGTRHRQILNARLQVQRLASTFERCSGQEGEFLGGEPLPVLFEIAQQLHDELESHARIFLPTLEKRERREKTRERAWPGSRIDREGGAPEKALEALKRAVDAHPCTDSDDRIVKATKAYDKAFLDYYEAMQRKPARVSFETFTKLLLVDECGHALNILRKGMLNGATPQIDCDKTRRYEAIEDRLNIFDVDVLKRDIDGIREKPQRYRILSAFRFDTRQMLRGELKTEKDGGVKNLVRWDRLLDFIEAEQEKYLGERKDSGDGRLFITPSSRFLIGAYLCLLKDPMALVERVPPDKTAKKASDDVTSPDRIPDDSLLLPRMERDSFTSRRSVMADRYDPLATTVRQLDIRRYITTNYDFEIERFFQDIGYRKFPPSMEISKRQKNKRFEHDDFRSDGIGGVLRDQTFSRKQAAELVGFTIGEERDDASVFHLHGRATREDSLVITERNYMNLYLWQDRHRDTVNEGILMAFSAAPLLFLGLGMTESDLLRPLRQFMSNRDRAIGYHAVALLPAEKNLDARTKLSASLYLRYGVHTVFYGSGAITFAKVKGKKPEELGLDWLCQIITIINTLRQVLSDYKNSPIELGGSGLGYLNIAPKEIVDRLVDAAGPIGDDIEGYGEGKWSAFFAACGRKVRIEDWKNGDPDNILRLLLDSKIKIQTCSFTPSRPRQSSAASRHYDKDVHVDGRIHLGFYTDLLSEVLAQILRMAEFRKKPTMLGAGPNRDFFDREVAALTIMLDGLQGGFLTGSLNASLIGIEREWRSWWKNWQESPPHRIARFERLRWPPKAAPKTAEDDTKVEALEAAQGAAKTVDICDLVPLRYVRHRVDNIFTQTANAEGRICGSEIRSPRDLIIVDDGKAAVLKPELQTRVRAFDTFIAAIASRRAPPDGSAAMDGAWPKAALAVAEDGHATFEAISRLGEALAPAEAAEFKSAAARAEEAATANAWDPQAPGRVLFTVFAHRGLGKGTFQTIFSTRLGLSLYWHALWQSSDPAAAPPFLAAAAFVNLSFATEIASTYDMLVDALIDVTLVIEEAAALKGATVAADVVQSFAAMSLPDASNVLTAFAKFVKYPKRRKDALEKRRRDMRDDMRHLSRLHALRVMTDKFAHASRRFQKQHAIGQPRFLICLNAVELFYDASGHPKNGEIAGYIETLLGDHLRLKPFDIVAIGSEIGIGPPIAANAVAIASRTAPLHLNVQLDRQGMSARAHELVLQRKTISGIDVVELDRDDPADPRLRKLLSMRDIDYPVNVRKKKRTSPEKITTGDVNFIHFARPFSPIALLVDNFPVLATALFIINPPRRPVPTTINDAFKKAVVDGRKASDAKMGELWRNSTIPSADELDKARKAVWTSVSEKLQDPLCAAYGAELGAASLVELLRKRLAENDNIHREEWRFVRRYIGYNRYSLTILLAAAEHIVIHARDPNEGGREAERFILNAINQVRSVSREQREEMIFQEVVDCYRRYNIIGDPDGDTELHHLILRHLGSVGAPLGSAVLVRLPEFRDYFHRVGNELPYSRRRFVARALTVLAYRGLVFRLAPHPRLMQLADAGPSYDDPHWSAEQEFRYSLHRVVQQYAVARLGALQVDPVSNNRFAPNLYASMNSGGTGLTKESYSFVRSLLIGLSQYPDIPQNDTSLRPWLFTTRNRNTRVQALRAAMSLARSTLSVARISRLSGHRLSGPGQPKRGYMETYKVRLRWIIRMAWELVDVSEGGQRLPPHSEEYKHINALYRDEIVWLYNELGVISLTQGNLSEAIAFLRQAGEFNEHIEGRTREGPIFRYIDINYAIVQMERGRIGSAEARLRHVKETTLRSAPLLHWLAEGYRCVIAHLRGEEEGLADRFREVTEQFQRLGDYRASAIFLMHGGRFHGRTDMKTAREYLGRAQALAETGGHEDVRHHVEIARINVEHQFELANMGMDGSRGRLPGPLPAGERALERLKDIESYGLRMGMWNIQADALRIRATLLLEQGENSTAGELAVRSMAISQRYGMELRLNSATTIYARILLERHDRRGAELRALRSLDMAKSMGYNLETSRAQRILSRINPETY